MNMHRTYSEAPLKIKIIMVGDSGVGKTNIKDRFCRGTFAVLSNSTIGVEYAGRKFWAPWGGKKERFEINFWDVAGTSTENVVSPLYFKNAMGVIYVYDITKENSLESLSEWRKKVLDHANCPKMTEVLIGNKSDLVNLR